MWEWSSKLVSFAGYPVYYIYDSARDLAHCTYDYFWGPNKDGPKTLVTWRNGRNASVLAYTALAMINPMALMAAKGYIIRTTVLTMIKIIFLLV